MLPNLLLIGASKAGTTSLHAYLAQHPDIFMCPVKEPGFFVFEGAAEEGKRFRDEPFVTTLDAYEKLFEGVIEEKVIGESSPQYLDLSSSRVVARIQRHLGQPKLIAVLRQPVDRAYSSYVMRRRDGREQAETFAKAIEREEQRWKAGEPIDRPYIYGAASYADQLAPYLEAFGPERLRIELYDDLRNDPQSLLQRLFAFLEVDTTFTPDMTQKHNPGGVQSNRFIAFLLNRPNPLRAASRRFLPAGIRHRGRNWLRRRNLTAAPPLPPQLRAELTATLQPQIEQLEPIIDRDLSAWKAQY